MKMTMSNPGFLQMKSLKPRMEKIQTQCYKLLTNPDLEPSPPDMGHYPMLGAKEGFAL